MSTPNRPRTIPCDACKATGWVPILGGYGKATCRKCGGWGCHFPNGKEQQKAAGGGGMILRYTFDELGDIIAAYARQDAVDHGLSMMGRKISVKFRVDETCSPPGRPDVPCNISAEVTLTEDS